MTNRNWDNPELYRSLAESSFFGTYILDGNDFYYVNPTFSEMFGYSIHQFKERQVKFEDLIFPEDLSIVKENINKRLADQDLTISYRVRAVKKDGSVITINIYGNILYHNDRMMVGGKVSDVTEQVLMETRLKLSEQRYRSLFEYNSDAVFQTDIYGQFIGANSACAAMSGYSQEELMEITFIPLVVSEDLEKTMHYFNLALNGEHNSFEVRIIRKDGQMVCLNCTSIPILVEGNIDGIYGIAKDITESKLTEQRINQMAYYDQLTQLPNRRLFEDRLSQALLLSNSYRHKMAVMYLDMDRFKTINDSFGHTKGDIYLKNIAERLKNCVTEETTVARIGGDEFAILLPKIIGENEALELACAISSELNKPCLIDGVEVIPSASIGISLNDGLSPKDESMLMREADIAMYQVKKNIESSFVIYSKEMDTRASYRLKLESDLRKAIELNQLILNYQPIVSIATGQINAVEALLRWNHPEMGIIPPNDFIPIAEETGLIISIGEWVLRTACEQNKAWQNEGLPAARMAVNVSLKQLQQAEFPILVKTILSEVDLEAKWLDLEITEGVLVQNQEIIKDKLRELRGIGVNISIDDFGTGYTSLNYLKTFLIDHLKIDRSFVQDINLDNNNNVIVSSLIALAHNLNINVIAEGIECEEQMTFLEKNDCDEVQGFIIGRPVENHQIRQMLTRLSEA
jgi:diguanylate cyclase (GGDEF)-like protein/PAS domain S-box-containing protein